MKRKEKFDVWQINNKEYIIKVIDIINNGLYRSNIVLDQKNLYEEMVWFLYNNSK